MRQEGRGIGLLEKIRAYNLQDMGYDTVAANLMLGHGADERGYEIAAAIMRDLGLGQEVRLLTNNPEKMEALTKEGITVKERLPMVPRSWSDHTSGTGHLGGSIRKPGATMIGGGAARGTDLEKYLRTKVQRMGHLLELPSIGHPQPMHDIVLPTAPSAFVKVTVSTSPVAGLAPLPTPTRIQHEL
jgi:GTP cyclohydrolase II